MSRLFTPVFFFFLCSFLPAAAQNLALIDSIRKVLPAQNEDSTKAILLNELGWEVSYGNLSEGLLYCQQALELSQKLQFKKGIADASNALGTIYEDMGDYSKALEAHHAAIELRTALGDKEDLGASYINIALVYRSMNDHRQALDYQLQALESFKAIDEVRGVCSAYNDAGVSYLSLGDTAEALKMFSQAEKRARGLERKHWLANSLSGMGVCYAGMGEHDQAEAAISEALSAINGDGYDYERISTLISLASIRKIQKRYDEAAYVIEQAMDIAKRIGMKDSEKELYLRLSEIYEASGKTPQALAAYKRHTFLKDSLLNENSRRHIREMETLYGKEKTERENERLRQKSERQIIFITAGTVALLLLLGLAFLLYNRVRIRQRSNEQLEKQKSIIEEKNKAITDSINYAQRIQSALMPAPKDFADSLREGFVLFRPKDIVSGDFFWLSRRGPLTFWATADCTGHGVPGGFMSMLGSSFLNEIINDKGLTEPAQILDLLREKVIAALKQTGSAGESKDGMDMVLCRIDRQTHELTYAAANNSFYTISGGTLTEHLPDKQPVGYHTEQKPFTQKTLQLRQGDMVYCFTDGYADQFGGPQGKKFKYRQFQETLLRISALNMDQQDAALEKTFDDWKGEIEQVDDVLVIGVRL